jgi:hypothetical protein
MLGIPASPAIPASPVIQFLLDSLETLSLLVVHDFLGFLSAQDANQQNY